MRGNKKRPPNRRGNPSSGLTNHKDSITRRKLFRQARNYIINGLAITSLIGVFLACSTEDIKLTLILAIPSLVYLGMYVYQNNI